MHHLFFHVFTLPPCGERGAQGPLSLFLRRELPRQCCGARLGLYSPRVSACDLQAHACGTNTLQSSLQRRLTHLLVQETLLEQPALRARARAPPASGAERFLGAAGKANRARQHRARWDLAKLGAVERGDSGGRCTRGGGEVCWPPQRGAARHGTAPNRLIYSARRARRGRRRGRGPRGEGWRSHSTWPAAYPSPPRG